MDQMRYPTSLEVTGRHLRIVVTAIIACVFLTALTSCGITTRIRKLAGDKQVIQVRIEANSNQDHPIALDLVHVFDRQLLERLRSMPSKEWFATRDQIKRDYLAGKGIAVWQKEWIPGQIVPRTKLPLKPGAKGAFIFANYQTPGAHRFFIDPFADIIIEFQEEDFVVRPD